MKFLTVCLNPVVQRTYLLAALKEDGVNRARRFRVDASGKGVNVTRVLHQLGERAVLLSQAGGAWRPFFLQLAARDGLEVEWVDSGTEIRICFTLLSEEAHTSTEIVEEAEPVCPATGQDVRERFSALLPGAGMLLLTGTQAPGFSPRLFPWMVSSAKAQGKAVLLDIRGTDLQLCLAEHPDFIKPNLTEFIHTFFPGNPDPPQEAVEERMLALSRAGTGVILTDGERPVRAAFGEKLHRLPVPGIVPVNTIGSGDAFAAGFSSCWMKTRDAVAAADMGIRCAQWNAGQLRPGSIRPDE